MATAEERGKAKRSRDARMGLVTKAKDKLRLAIAMQDDKNIQIRYKALMTAVNNYEEVADSYRALLENEEDDTITEDMRNEPTIQSDAVVLKLEESIRCVQEYCKSIRVDFNAFIEGRSVPKKVNIQPDVQSSSDDDSEGEEVPVEKKDGALVVSGTGKDDAAPPTVDPMEGTSAQNTEREGGEPNSTPNNSKAADSISRDELYALMTLPKSEILTFDGNPLEYHSFMLTFEEQVGALNVPAKTKMSRLYQHTSGAAREAIKSCVLLPKNGYSEALKILKNRFGNSFVIADSVVRSLKDGGPIRTAEEMSRLADALTNARLVLKTITMFKEVNTQETIVKICERIPAYLKHRWRREVYKHKGEDGKYPGFTSFTKFVGQAAEEMADPLWGERMSSGKPAPRSHPPSWRKGPSERKSTAASFVTPSPVVGEPEAAVAPRRPPCILCSANHSLLVCQQFRQLKVKERWELVKNHKLCINCLRAGHKVENCKSEHTCTVDSCGVKHSNFLHTKPNVMATTTHVTDTTSSFATGTQPESYLPCVNVKVNGQLVSALLDSGSSNTFCDQKLARTLGLKGRDVNYSITTLTSSGKDICSSLVDFNVTSVDGKESLPFSNVYVIDAIPIDCPSVMNVDYAHFKGIKFANVRNVQLLIGQDQSEALLPLEVRKGRQGEPFATRTLFGWALNGPNVTSGVPSHRVVSNFVKTTAKTEPDINSLIRMDDEGVCDGVGMSKQDKYVVQLWEQECVKVDGRYQLPIPFKPDVEVPNNFQAALSRLQRNRSSLVKRNLFDKYNDEIVKLLSEGYAEEVLPGVVSGDRVWYLPHQAVVTDKKPGKLRVVFDCAAKYKGESLNDKCFQGPNLTNKLLDVLLRFRQDPYVVVGDVQAMYYQVLIPPEQRDALRFLWYKGDQIVHYRMTRHVFGGVWCSSSSSFALLRTIQDNPGYPEVVVNTVKESFYVDDCLRSLPELGEVTQVLEGSRELLSKGGFKLTKFIVNDFRIQEAIPESERAKEYSLVKEGAINSKALGIDWSVDDDMFHFDVNLTDFVSVPLTKRKMLSLVSSLYDPLGFVGPIVVAGRLVLQEVTRLKYGWDDKLPDPLVDRWHSWVKLLSSVSQVRVPRCIKPHAFNDAALELHIFSDASQVAYGVACYLRSSNKNGQINVCLVMAKSKVAPVKAVTIPRLELQAALLAARVDLTVRSELRLDLAPSTFWVDSEIVLCYLSNSSRRFQTFVANRVSAIQDLTCVEQWKFVPGVVNPADLITRGKEMSFEDRNRWFSGPSFLHLHKSEWPEFEGSAVSDTLADDPEVRSGSCFATNVCTDRLPELLLRESSWYSLKRTLVWLCRYFRYLCTKTVPDRKISLAELDSVEASLVRYVQGQKYGAEVRALKAGKELPADSSIVSLGPVLDQGGILVVGGRTGPPREEVTRPIIIPHDHLVASMIAFDYHSVAHCGTEWVVSDIRKKFWITKIRVVVKGVSSRCMLCKRLFAKVCSQKMADLPPERVTSGGKPFTCVGIDCFGPFETKVGRITVKRYGCIFTCFSIRAVHIEKLDTMDTDSFLNAFRRFVARRGRPEKVWSDNGSNFQGGSIELNRALQALDKDAIAEYGVSQSIEWKFNPPLASHMGGVWERVIRTVRKVFLGISRGDYTYNDDVLSTWFCEVESMVNGRPITKVGDDPSDSAPLTPNHLLLLSGQNYGPPGEFSDSGYGRRWRRVQHLADMFWKRWIREYLPELQVRSKWHRQKENLRIGDFVLLVGEDTPRTLWPKGIISEVFTGSDGLVRSARVRTRSRSFIRPVSKIVLLEGSVD